MIKEKEKKKIQKIIDINKSIRKKVISYRNFFVILDLRNLQFIELFDSRATSFFLFFFYRYVYLFIKKREKFCQRRTLFF